jgi:hypothetical protein
LLKHRQGGVQQRHYDRHDYREEKLAAMRALSDRMAGREPSNVVALRAAS